MTVTCKISSIQMVKFFKLSFAQLEYPENLGISWRKQPKWDIPDRWRCT